MTRPAGPLPIFASDDDYDAPGKTWDGQPTKVALSADEQAQGFDPSQRLPAPKFAYKLNQIDRWLEYLDGIESKNWDHGIELFAPDDTAEGFGIGTTRDEIVSNFGRQGFQAGGAATGFTFSAAANGANVWVGDATDNATQGSELLFPLDNVPHGAMITGFSVQIDPEAHANLPQHMPQLRLRAYDFAGSAGTLPAAATTIVVDPSTPVATYNAAHSFGASGTQIPIDRSLYRYFLVVIDEWGTNSTNPSLKVANVKVTLRETPDMSVPASPPASALSLCARHSVAWNSLFSKFYSLTVRDQNTVPLESASGAHWTPISTGFAAPTQSTVDLTFTATGDGTVYEGSAYTDGTHVWILDADHSWSGAGSKGPWQATIYSPGSPAYYGPIEAPASSVTGFLSDHPDVSAVNNATDGTPGTDPLGGYEGSIAVDTVYGSMVAVFRGYANEFLGDGANTLVSVQGPGGGSPGAWSAESGDFDKTAHGPLCVTYAPGIDVPGNAGVGAFLVPAMSFSGHRPRLFYLYSLSGSGPGGAHEETLDNAAAYTVVNAFAAASSVGVVYISHDGADNSLWVASLLGGAYVEHGTMSVDGLVVALEWSETDSLFVIATNTGHVYTSTDGITWAEPFGAVVGTSFSHLCIVGGSWLFVGDTGEAEVIYWTGSQGRTWQQVPAPWQGGTVISLCAVNGGAAVHHVDDDGVARIYRSNAVQG